jgi:hypothetical protein
MRRRLTTMAEGFFGRDYADKAVSIGLVLLLHILVLASLLAMRVKHHEFEPRETILRLLPFLHSEPAPQAPAVPEPQVAPMRRPIVPTIVPEVAPPTPAEPSATVLAPALNDCALENLDNLSPEQRAKCATYREGIAGAARAKDRAGLNQPTKSKSADDWAQAIVRRNTAARVDCTKIETVDLGLQSNMKSTQIMVDLGCAARHLANGESPLK